MNSGNFTEAMMYAAVMLRRRRASSRQVALQSTHRHDLRFGRENVMLERENGCSGLLATHCDMCVTFPLLSMLSCSVYTTR